TASFVQMDGSGGSWPSVGFCRTLIGASVSGSAYAISVSLYNLQGRSGYGHLGILYNAKDINNFDFVYFRPHWSGGCFQTGYVKNGVVVMAAGSVSAKCSNGVPPHQKWFTAKVEVRGKSVSIYKNGQRVAAPVSSHFAATGKGGVLVANGYKNAIRYKDYQLRELQPYPVSSCVGVSKLPSYVQMVGKGGSWPSVGFCRTLIGASVSDSAYAISVSLYNLQGRSGYGHLGILYNAKDINNFDFVYFRPHWSGGCFQTGYVENGVVVMAAGSVSAKCSNGAPPHQKWFTAKVEVRGKSVSIYKNGQRVAAPVSSHFAATGKGGVLVANGYKNTIRYKDYKLRELHPYPVSSCDGVSKFPSYVQMVGRGGSWPSVGFCRTLIGASVSDSAYAISVSLYNLQGSSSSSQGVGHLGILYNDKDINNFDFVYFRPHSSGGCFQTGYVKNGVVVIAAGSVSAKCSNGAPPHQKWFTAKVEVRGKSVSIYKNGQRVAAPVSSHFAATGKGGVLVANGYKNTIRYKDYKLRELHPYPVSSCDGVSKFPSYVQMVGKGGSWPSVGFCRTLIGASVSDSAYAISVSLYNLQGSSNSSQGVGHLGILYNAKDIHNFDFVYFRPHWSGGCFQTGYVKNGVVVMAAGSVSAKCSNGVPPHQKWFTAKVEVRGKSVSIYKNGQRVAAPVSSHFATTGKGGVLVANGYKNTIRYKDYKLRELHPYPVSSCVGVSKLPSYVQMVGKGGSWPSVGFCRTLIGASISGSAYAISVSLYNLQGRSGYGHLGILYNAKDINNFDFVYFRPHWSGGCFQTGYVKNGVVVMAAGSVSAKCSNGAPPHQKWFTAKVEVRGKSVSIYKNGQRVAAPVSSHFAATGKGGVLVANGYKNTIRYKDYKLREIHPYPVSSCVGVSKLPSYVQMVGKGGSWPSVGFCRTLIGASISGSAYAISVSLYNLQGRSGYGHLGILYNAKDIHNFDFVYFRPHSTGGCFQTGYVKNGVVVMAAGSVSAKCSNGAPPHQKWFTAKVEVRGKSVSIYKNGQRVAAPVSSHFAATGKGGVLVANGYKNTIRYKDYKLRELHPYPVSSCVGVSKLPSYVQMVGKGGSWPSVGFCRTLIGASISGSAYAISVSLYNLQGRSGYGHLGILYNAKDINNFDFVYFRPHSTGGCFQTGYVKNGVVVIAAGSVSAKCSNGAPPHQKWFTAKVEVRGKSVSIYKNGQRVAAPVSSHFAATGKGGVLVANGYKNTIRYKDYKLRELHPYPVSSCVGVSKLPSYVQMVGKGGSWPSVGFCRTLIGASISGSAYAISVSLYNLQGRSGYGHLGILYNAKDINNFDFVYFRPHWSGGCFQTGYVENGVVVMAAGSVSAKCSNGAPPHQKWFTAKVEVRGKSVSIYKNGQRVAAPVSSHFVATGKGGVLVANGYKNTIRYKDYKLRELHPYPVSSCDGVSKFPSYVQMVGKGGSWPSVGFCRTLIGASVSHSAYAISVSLYNLQGSSSSSQGVGHLGILYNDKDINNFDFVYFRLASFVRRMFPDGLRGKMVLLSLLLAQCLPSAPMVHLHTRSGSRPKWKSVANLSASTRTANEWQHRLAAILQRLAKVACWLPMATKTPFVIKTTNCESYIRTQFSSCDGVSKFRSYVQLVGKGGSWPSVGFCRTLIGASVSDSAYAISVSLYNLQGSSNSSQGVGHLGILYNAKDIHNFDFVYFRPHSTGGCFQTGYVKNGVVVMAAGSVSAKCSNGAPPHQKWFTAKVEVRGKSVSIYKNGQRVAAPMVGKGGSWPSVGFCRTLIGASISGSAYAISVSLYNLQGRSGYGHLGILYNAKDINNFDFVYFRPHSTGGCFQTGYVKNGVVVMAAGSVSAKCSNGAPPHQKWFTAKVEVRGKSVSIYKNGQRVAAPVSSHFAATGKGGVLVANGYKNTIRYKDYKLRELHPYPVSSCVGVSKLPSYVQMVGKGGSWPSVGFCRTLIGASISGSAYAISVSLYNLQGRSGYGHLGILYNAKDINNFDFVYFRPHSTGGCFQTGYVKNGVVVIAAGSVSAKCSNGAPPHQKWFTAKVEVRGKSVSIYKNGQRVAAPVSSHFAATGKGGVLVANGYKNTIRYKDYKLRELHPYPVSSCVGVSKLPSYVQMVGKGGSWPSVGFCRTLIGASISGSAYAISVSLYNLQGRSGYGHLGILYNAKDINNFDFVYFRPHSTGGCFQTGYVKNGVVVIAAGSVSAKCSNGAPPHQKWFTAKVEVRGKSVSIYKNGQRVAAPVSSHFAATGKGGVLVANGYKNTIRYKDYKLRELHPYPVSSCVGVSKLPSYVQMVGKGGSWPSVGFCRTLIGASISGSAYAISVSLYNLQGRSGYGHLGILYNAKDINNFDFVYFRPHSTGGCFQTGYVKNGVVVMAAGSVSAKCSNGVPPHQKWFTAKVEVRGKSVSIYKNGQRVAAPVSSHFAATGKGGVLVANGYKNTIRYKDYKLCTLLEVVLGNTLTFHSCPTFSRTASFVQMDGSGGSWPSVGFCRTLIGTSVSGSAYAISVSLYNLQGRSGYGHLGILYNAKDINNFDFVYFRPHSSGGCFQTGYVKNGVVVIAAGSVSAKCSNGVPPHQKWFTAKVEVRGKSVSIYKNGQRVAAPVSSHFAATGKGGVLVANGYKNTIRYKDYKLRELHLHPVSSCDGVSKFPSYVQMVGKGGSWPSVGFCRTLIGASVSGSAYAISVSLYNLQGRSGYGHLGILYNAKDINNFDFVYFRPHSSGGCFQTGYVKNGVVVIAVGSVSAKCSNGVPPHQKWFTAKVEVRGKSVSIYKNGQRVAAPTSKMASKRRLENAENALALVPQVKKPRQNQLAVAGKGNALQALPQRTSSLEAPIMLLTGQELSVSTMFTASTDKTIALWDYETGSRIKRLKGHTSFVNSCCPSRRGLQYVVSGSDDCTIKLWDTRKRGCVQTFQNIYQVTSVSFNDTSDQIFSGGIDDEIKVWDLRKNDILYKMSGHTDTISGLRLSPDGSFLLSNSMDNTVRMWDVRAFAPMERCLKVFLGSQHSFEKNLIKCGWSPDGLMIAAGSAD
ncbi:hypothetical protein QZH41_019992, partial [Actinostola sp. cb2023]